MSVIFEELSTKCLFILIKKLLAQSRRLQGQFTSRIGRNFWKLSLNLTRSLESQQKTWLWSLWNIWGWKKCASSSLWTKYSQLNGIVKAKYSFDLGKYPRIKAQIKMFDTDVKTKAKIFDKDALDAFLGDSTLFSTYWLLRKSVTVVCFFGGNNI